MWFTIYHSKYVVLALKTVTLRFLLYVLVLLYVLFEKFCLIFTYTYRMMAFFYFLLGEKSKNLNFSLSFQIYVPYDLKNQASNIYKYRTYNRNLRVLIFKKIFILFVEIFSILPAVIRAYPLIKFGQKFQSTLFLEPPLVLETYEYCWTVKSVSTKFWQNFHVWLYILMYMSIHRSQKISLFP